MKWIVCLQHEKDGRDLVFLAPWSGDPGRTCVYESANRYDSISSATFALAHARKYHDFVDAKIIKE